MIIVGSISGRTGGGIMLDLAYAARSQLKKLGFDEEQVHGILLHSTPLSNKERDKAIGNAFATLRELGHYSAPGNYYPGESAADVPSFHGNNRTFGSAYVVNLGEQIDTPEWEAANERVAEYLYYSTVTPDKFFFDQSREVDTGTLTSDSSLIVRSFSVGQLGGSNNTRLAEITEQACRDLVTLWQRGEIPQIEPDTVSLSEPTTMIEAYSNTNSSASADIASTAARLMSQCGLTVDAIRNDARQLFEQEVSRDEDAYLTDLIQQSITAQDGLKQSRRDVIESTVQLIDRVFDTSDPSESGHSIPDVIRERLSVRAKQSAGQLVVWISNSVDDVKTRVEGAGQLSEALKTQLEDRQAAVNQQSVEIREATDAIHFELTNSLGDEREHKKKSRWPFRSDTWQQEATDKLLHYGRGRLELAKLSAIRKQIAMIDSQIATAIDGLNYLSRDLNRLSENFQTATFAIWDIDNQTSTSPTQQYQQAVLDLLGSEREQLARELESTVDTVVFTGNRKLQRFLDSRSELQHTLTATLRTHARQTVLKRFTQINRRFVEGESLSINGRAKVRFVDLISTALESVPGYADHQTERLLVLIPDVADASNIRAECEAAITNSTVLGANTFDVVVCREAGCLSLESVAHQIVHGHEIYRELGSRLLTRIDIDFDRVREAESNRSAGSATST